MQTPVTVRSTSQHARWEASGFYRVFKHLTESLESILAPVFTGTCRPYGTDEM